MQLDYQLILDQFGDIVQMVLPLAITLGLCQWVVRFVLNAFLGRYGGKID